MTILNWMTMAWSICIGICCFLGLVNLFWGLVSRQKNAAYLLTAGMAFSAVINGVAELSIIHSLDIEQTAFWLKIENSAVFGMLVNMVWLVYIRLPKARFWLASAITGLWSIGFLVNIFSDYSLTFSRLDSISKIATFGSLSFSMPQGPAHPLKIIADICSLLLLVYFIDASISSYRSGERSKSVAVGASTVSFILIGGVHSPLVDAGIIHTPYLVSFAFLTMVLFMSAELVLNAVKAADYKEQASRSNKRWQRVIDAAPLLVIECDLNGRIRYVNPFAEKLLLKETAELVDQPIAEYIPVLRQNFYGYHAGCNLTGKIVENRTVHKVELINIDNEKHILNMMIIDVEADCSEPIKVLICRDIGDWLELQRELNDTRSNLELMTRVSLLGELTATLTHELNQPLTTILSNAQAAKRFIGSKPFEEDELHEILNDIIEQDRRASGILRNVRNMVENRKEVQEPIELNQLIQSVVLLLENEAEHIKVKVDLDLAERLPETYGNPVAIQQVIMNLLLNAFKAAPRRNDNDSPHVRIHSSFEGENLIVAVEDNGEGIVKEMADRIFDPFVTNSNGNIGLGLSIAKRIAEDHDGNLSAENIANGGARFTFILPQRNEKQ